MAPPESHSRPHPLPIPNPYIPSLRHYVSATGGIVFLQCKGQNEHNPRSNRKHHERVNVRQTGGLRLHGLINPRVGLRNRARLAQNAPASGLSKPDAISQAHPTSEEHTSQLQSPEHPAFPLLL